MPPTLAESLRDWTDWDIAAWHVGCALGVIPDPDHAKPIFWTDNPLGNALHEILLQLVNAGVLERRDEPDDQYRWKRSE